MKLALKTILLVTTALLTASLGEAMSNDTPTQAEEFVVANNCLLEYGQVSEIGANMFGAIREINVRQGDRVKGGQVLGRLRDQDLRAELELLRTDSENTNLIKQTEAKYQKAQIEKEINQKLVDRKTGLVPGLRVLQQLKEADEAKWEMEQAKFAQKLLRLKRDQLEAEVHLKEFVCPHDGVVTDIYKKQSEAVTVNDRVMRIVNTEFFRVVGAVDLTDAWRVKIGQKVRVYPDVEAADIAIAKEVFLGEVVYVDREVDPKTQTCRVVAELKNRDDLLRAGLPVRMEVIQKDEATPTPTAKAPEAKTEGPKPPPQ